MEREWRWYVRRVVGGRSFRFRAAAFLYAAWWLLRGEQVQVQGGWRVRL